MTGWIRYRICDKSGGGWNRDKWFYEPWLCEEGEECPEEVRDHVIHTRENWAIYAESYSFESEVNATPPTEVIEKEIAKRKNKLSAMKETIADLESSL
jgi:hypothetical protein